MQAIAALFDEMLSTSSSLDDVERSLIVLALERAQGNQTEAAKFLGISRYALRYRAQRYKIPLRTSLEANQRRVA